MKDCDSVGGTNTVAAAATSSTSSSSSIGTAFVTSTRHSSVSSSTENHRLVCWQCLGAGDLHSTSDTDDGELDLGIGRLVIDLEADLDSKPCGTGTEMKSSNIAQKATSSSLTGSSSTSNTTPSSNTTPLHGSFITVSGSGDSSHHLLRATKAAPAAGDSSKPSHCSLVKNVQSNSNIIPVSTMQQSDLGDRGIKMRIKCGQPTQSPSSTGPMSKHEVLRFHSAFLTNSVENSATLPGKASSLATSRPDNDRSLQGSGGLGKPNCGRSSHKKDRHSVKDRSKVVGRPFADEIGCNSSSGSPSSNCATVVSKEATDIALKSDAVSNDVGPQKIMTVSSDPYEFNMKTEDTVGVAVKKIKLDRCDVSSSPIVELCLPPVEKKDAYVDASHIGTITEPECLGPCEPGTSVTLEGIVWNETENGLLVVNVTWRGKTYVGTLMDSTKHHWAPPRFSGDSPTSDFETRTPKGRGKRGRTCVIAQRNESNGSDRKLRSNRFSKPAAPSPVRNDVNPLKRSRPETSSSDGLRGSKCSRSDSRTSDSGNGSAGVVGELVGGGGGMIECPEENCSKKYRHLNGLRYHQTRVHRSSCTTLAKDANDAEVSKYIDDDFVENSTVVDRALQSSRNLTSERSNSASRKPVHPLNKPVETHCKTEESLGEMRLRTKSVGDGGAMDEEEVKEHGTTSEKMSSEVSPKVESGYKSHSVDIVGELRGQSGSKISNSFHVINDDNAKMLGVTHQPSLSLTPVPVPLTPVPVPQDSSKNISTILQTPSVSGRRGLVSIVQFGTALPSGSLTTNESSSTDPAKDRDKVKKPRAEKLDRSKLKTPSDSALRPVIPIATAPSASVATANPLISSPSLMSSTVAAQSKTIPPKVAVSSEHTNLDSDLAALSDRNKKRKRDREKQREPPATTTEKPTPVVKSDVGSDFADVCQSTSQSSAPVTVSIAGTATSNETGTGQVKYSLPGTNVPVTTASSSFGSFGQPTVSPTRGTDQTVSVTQRNPITATARNTGTFDSPSTQLQPASIADQPVLARTDPVTCNDELSSDNEAALSASTLSTQHLLLPSENLNVQPVVGLPSPLKVVPSSVIKTNSNFDVNAISDLAIEPKSLSVSDADLPCQPVTVEKTLPVLLSGANSDFSTKSNESGTKPAQDRLQSASGLHSSSTSPGKKAKNPGAKQSEGGNVVEFSDPHSPAYSDISDANDNAPLLDAPMLEKEAHAAAEEEDTIGSKVSPNNTQDAYVYSPFYGQPPYLTPAVPSSDHSECGPALKSPLKNSLLEKHQVMDKSKTEAVGEKRLMVDSGPIRSRPNEIPLKFSTEQSIRDDKETRDKAGRAMNSGPTHSTTKNDMHKPQQHKLCGETALPPHVAMMPHMAMPATYAFGTSFGFLHPEYNEQVHRMYQQFHQQQQQQEARRHDYATASKLLADGGDHSKTRPPVKISTEGKHCDEKFKPVKFEGTLPMPPILIPDRNRPELTEELGKTDRNREKPPEGRKITKDGVETKNIAEFAGGTKHEGGFDMKMLTERTDIQRFCMQPHFIEQQQRLNEHQSHKSATESGAGGCKPSAVVAPQTRDKNASVGGMAGTAVAASHGTKQQRDDSQGRVHDSHRAHRDVQKSQPVTPPQQNLHPNKGVGSSRDGSSGRMSKESVSRPGIKDDSGSPGSRGSSLKVREDSPMTSLPISVPTGIPTPYASYYSHYLPAAAYAGAMPFDPNHAGLYPGMIGYPPPPYMHPAQMLSPALAIASADGKPCDVPQPTSAFFSNEGKPHKIHELKEASKTQAQGDRSQPSPGNRDSARPKSRGSGSHSTGKDSDHGSPPTQRHLHTHHHMHVVSPLYQYVHSDAALIASQQAAATAATQLPRPFLAK